MANYAFFYPSDTDTIAKAFATAMNAKLPLASDTSVLLTDGQVTQLRLFKYIPTVYEFITGNDPLHTASGFMVAAPAGTTSLKPSLALSFALTEYGQAAAQTTAISASGHAYAKYSSYVEVTPGFSTSAADVALLTPTFIDNVTSLAAKIIQASTFPVIATDTSVNTVLDPWFEDSTVGYPGTSQRGAVDKFGYLIPGMAVQGPAVVTIQADPTILATQFAVTATALTTNSSIAFNGGAAVLVTSAPAQYTWSSTPATSTFKVTITGSVWITAAYAFNNHPAITPSALKLTAVQYPPRFVTLFNALKPKTVAVSTPKSSPSTDATSNTFGAAMAGVSAMLTGSSSAVNVLDPTKIIPDVTSLANSACSATTAAGLGHLQQMTSAAQSLSRAASHATAQLSKGDPALIALTSQINQPASGVTASATSIAGKLQAAQAKVTATLKGFNPTTLLASQESSLMSKAGNLNAAVLADKSSAAGAMTTAVASVAPNIASAINSAAASAVSQAKAEVSTSKLKSLMAKLNRV